MGRKKTGEKPKKKRRIPIPMKCLIILLIILIASGTVFAVYMNQQTNPDRIVRDYISAFMAKDSSALFHYLGMQENSFINAGSFERSLEECRKYSTISSYGLTKYADPATPDLLQYKIEYWNNSHGNPYTETLVLKRSELRLYGFFDDWQIDTTEFLATNCRINAPSGTTVAVDGITLTPGPTAAQTDQLVSCELGSLFAGTHEITISAQGFEDFKTSVFLDNKDYSSEPFYTITPSMLKITQDTEKQLEKTAEKMIKALYGMALNTKSFDALHEKYPFEESVREDLRKKYNTLINNNIHSSTHLTGVAFDSFSSSFSTAYAEDECYAVKITTAADYTSDSLVRTETSSEKKSTTGNSLFITTFHYRDGSWFIHDTTALTTCVYYIKIYNDR